MDSLIGGFVPKPKTAFNERFSLTRNFGAASLDLPKRFSVEDQKGDVNGPRNQGWNFCTACTMSEIGADEWGVPMSQKFQALAISLIIKSPLALAGAPVDDAMKSGRIYGFLPLSEEPPHIAAADVNRDAAMICDPVNWPADSFTKALKYQIPGGDFYVDGPYDHFDNYRAALYAHRPDNGISLGVCWASCFSYSRDDGIIRCSLPSGSWHDIALKGWEEVGGKQYVVARSWASNAGRKGYFLFNRARFNELMSVQGAVGKMFKNVDEAIVADLKERRLSISEQIMNLYYRISFLLAQLNR